MKKFFSNFENHIMAGALFIMSFITVINVVSRKFLHLSMSFLEEITTAMFILISLLGTAAAARKGAHLGLSIFTDLIPKKNQKYVTAFSTICAVFFSYFLIRYGIDMVISEVKSGQTTPSLGWPEWIFGLAIPVGGLMILIRFIEFGLKSFRAKEDERCQ